MSFEESLQELGLFSLEQRWFGHGLTNTSSPQHLKGRFQGVSQALHSSVWWEEMKLWAEDEKTKILTGNETLFPMGQLSRAVGCLGR